jgi:hypothetical protein
MTGQGPSAPALAAEAAQTMPISQLHVVALALQPALLSSSVAVALTEEQ